MINYRVENIEELVEGVREAGVKNVMRLQLLIMGSSFTFLIQRAINWNFGSLLTRFSQPRRMKRLRSKFRFKGHLFPSLSFLATKTKH
jgi:hypothetical protein